MITNDSIEIKRIGVDDAALLSDVAICAYSDHYLHLWHDEGKWYIEKSFSVESLLHELGDANAWFYIIYYNKEAVGFLKLNIDAQLFNEENCKGKKQKTNLVKSNGQQYGRNSIL